MIEELKKIIATGEKIDVELSWHTETMQMLIQHSL